MKTVLGYLKNYRLRIAAALTLKVCGTLMELLLPFLLSHILKDVIKTRQIAGIAGWGLVMMLCAGAACILNYTGNRTAAGVSCDFSRQLRGDLFHRILYLSPRQEEQFTVASLESRITTDTYHVHQFVNMIQRMGIRAPVFMIGGAAITLAMDRRLALVMLAVIPLSVLAALTVSRFTIPMYLAIQKNLDRMIRVVREDTYGIRVIRALSRGDFEQDRYDRVSRVLVQSEQRAGLVMGIAPPVMNLLMNMGMVAVIGLGAVYVSRGVSAPETVIAFLQYFTQICMAMMALTRMFAMTFKAVASAGRIEEVLLSPRDLEQIPAVPAQENLPLIAFRNVTFSYEGGQPDLQDITFCLDKGESLGIIGATGCGKSTLIRLLLRFYDPDQGQIFLSGRDIRTLSRQELYSHFGAVMQNDFLYADTIEENIRFGRDLDREQVLSAARMAQARDFITAFPEGYGHFLSQKATNVSGGQKQRLLIARALAGDPEVLILDDSASALDYRTESMLREALQRQPRKITRITVAQRVSSIRHCSRILVLDEGKIIGTGTYDQLLKNCSVFRQIHDSQEGGTILD